jgi:hypothetical protein
MVAHSGFLTVARKVEPGFWSQGWSTPPVSDDDDAAQEGEKDDTR